MQGEHGGGASAPTREEPSRSTREALADPRLPRALEDEGFRESLFGRGDALEAFLRLVGAYSEATYDEEVHTDWNGAVVDRGSGAQRRAAIPPSAELPFAEVAPLLAMGSCARRLVARHPATPAAALVELAADADFVLAHELSARAEGDGALERLLATRGSVAVRKELAGRQDLAAGTLALLLADADAGVRTRVACRGDLSEEALARLAGDPAQGVRAHVAKNKSTSTASLARLAVDPSIDVRLAAARNLRTPAEAIEAMAALPVTADVAQAIVNRPGASAPLLERLGAHPEARAAVAKSHAVPESLAVALAGDADPTVRATLAAHTEHPAAVALLARDQAVAVRRVVAGRATREDDLALLAADADHDVRLAVAKRATHAAVLARLVDDPWWEVLEAVAANPNTTALADLATAPSETVRARLAARRDLPADVLDSLARDTGWLVLRALRENPSLPASLAPVVAEGLARAERADAWRLKAEASLRAIASGKPR